MTTNQDIITRELTTTTPMRCPHLRRGKRSQMKWAQLYVGYWQDHYAYPADYVHVLKPKPRSKPVRSKSYVQLSLFD